MLEQIADAFKRKDYQTAAKMVKRLALEEPENPWVQFYVGYLHEVKGSLDAAENAYRHLLRNCTHAKIVAQARQGLQRLEDRAKERRRQELAKATANPGSTELGVLVLEPINSELKQVAAQHLARIMQIDPYTARLQLPSRGWRLYRSGSVGKMQFYTEQLRQAEIPSFSATLAHIDKLSVFRVDYFQSAAPEVTVICQNETGQSGSLTFKWSEVSQRVEGILPIFDEIVDFDARHKLQRKTQIMDYVQFCDLHLPTRSSILRLCDRHYQFQQGIPLSQPKREAKPSNQATARKSWNYLINFLNQQLPQTPIWSDFTTFAETALDQTELLRKIRPHIELLRRKDSLWDSAFQLYSGLIFLKSGKF